MKEVLGSDAIVLVQFLKFEKVDFKILVTNDNPNKEYGWKMELMNIEQPFYNIGVESNLDGTKLYTLTAKDGFKEKRDVFREVKLLNVPWRHLNWETLEVVVYDLAKRKKRSLQEVLDKHGWNKIEGPATYSAAKAVCTECSAMDDLRSILFDEGTFFYKSDWNEKIFDECVYVFSESHEKMFLDLQCESKRKRSIKIYNGEHLVLGKPITLRVSIDDLEYGEVAMKEFVVSEAKITNQRTSGKFFAHINPFK